MQLGILDISNDEHRALKQFPSFSELKLFNRCPAVYKHEILDGNKRESTSQQLLGTLIHLAVLEPKEFEKKVKPLSPEVDFRKKEYKALKEQIKLDERDGVYHVKASEYKNFLKIQNKLLNHPLVGDFIKHCDMEKSVVWIDEMTGVQCKGRIDGVSVEKRIAIDLKTTKDAQSFLKTVIDYKYHVQAAFYMDAIKTVTGVEPSFYWIAVETSAPHLHCVYQPSRQMLDIGREEYRHWLARYKKCFEQDVWPGLSEFAVELNLPDWYVERVTRITEIGE
jgi:exodeoxyribonuclease VIII